MKRAVLAVLVLAFVSCAKKSPEIKTVNYSLLEGIYQKVDREDLEKVEKIQVRDRKVVKTPVYVKVYRGSYADEKGNVVEGGMEYLRIRDAVPDTDF